MVDITEIGVAISANAHWETGPMGDVAAFKDVASYALDALAIGVIVTDLQGRKIFSNAAADRILAQRSGALACQGGRIGATHGATQNHVQASLALVGQGQSKESCQRNHLLAPAPAESSPDLAICILPFEVPGGDACAMWIVRAIERDCNLEVEAQRLFGLSKAEARFASSLASGQSLGEAAKTHKVTVATARSHMKNIFRKTGFTRQSQVAAMLRGAQMPI